MNPQDLNTLLEFTNQQDVQIVESMNPKDVSKYSVLILQRSGLLRVRSEVGQVDFSSCSSDGASDILSVNRY